MDTALGFEDNLLPVGSFLTIVKQLPLGAGPRETIAQLRQRTEQRWAHVPSRASPSIRQHHGVLWDDGLFCVTLRGKSTGGSQGISSLPSPTLRSSSPDLISTYLPAMQSSVLTGGTGLQHD